MTALPLQVLGPAPDAGERKDLVSKSQTGVAIENDMGVESVAGPQSDSRSDHAIGSYFASITDLCAGVDDRGGVDR